MYKERIVVYDVQTFYGTCQKTFLSAGKARDYYKRLSREYDGCVDPIHKRYVTDEEFVYEDLAD